jgi:hypothetical protein
MTAPDPSAPTDALDERVEFARQRLIQEFQAKVSPEVISSMAAESARSYSNAVVQDFVPLFVERTIRERLQAQLR